MYHFVLVHYHCPWVPLISWCYCSDFCWEGKVLDWMLLHSMQTLYSIFSSSVLLSKIPLAAIPERPLVVCMQFYCLTLSTSHTNESSHFWGSSVHSVCWLSVLVTQSCPTLCHPMDCSWPGFSFRGILHARILVWVAISFSRRSSWPRDWTQPPTLQADSLPSEPLGTPMFVGWKPR